MTLVIRKCKHYLLHRKKLHRFESEFILDWCILLKTRIIGQDEEVRSASFLRPLSSLLFRTNMIDLITLINNKVFIDLITLINN